MAHVAATDKADERAALAEITAQLGLGLAQRRADRSQDEGGHALFDRVVDAWADAEPEEAATGICLDITLIHVASMSNLFAALGWHLVDLLEHPDEAEAGAARRDRPGRDLCARVDADGAALHHGPLHARAVRHRPRGWPARRSRRA